MEARPAIPANLQRQLFIEAGYKCSVPACGVTSPLEIDHIEEWSRIREHRYENLLVLCANHHAMKGGVGPRQLNTAALRIIKQNQMEINGRYGDIERRVLEYFVGRPEVRWVHLPGDFDVLLMRLLEAGILLRDPHVDGSLAMALPEPETPEALSDPALFRDETGRWMLAVRWAYRLTEAGAEYVAALREARAVPSPTSLT